MSKSPTLVHIINRRTDCLAFGPYRVGEVYAVDAATAARLAPRGFVTAEPIPATSAPSTPIED